MAFRERKGLNRVLFYLYEGAGLWPSVFRWTLLLFDIATITYFIVYPFESRPPSRIWIDWSIGTVIALDLAARFYIAGDKKAFWRSFVNWVDALVVVTMFAPLLLSNLAFLRALRAIRVVHAFAFVRRVDAVAPFLRKYERITDAVLNLFAFIFVASAFVYLQQVTINPGINNFLDALYFTVTTLTTTGYGDILIEGTTGRLLAVAIMVLGLTLFFRLAQAAVDLRPNKADYTCPACKLRYHDHDAAFCRACGSRIEIPTDGHPRG